MQKKQQANFSLEERSVAENQPSDKIPRSICLATSCAADLPSALAVSGLWPILSAAFLALWFALEVALCLKLHFLTQGKGTQPLKSIIGPNNLQLSFFFGEAMLGFLEGVAMLGFLQSFALLGFFLTKFQ